MIQSEYKLQEEEQHEEKKPGQDILVERMMETRTILLSGEINIYVSTKLQ